LSRAGDFKTRARAEADRYGPDPWIFVRELLQNARDAGATRVVFKVDEDDDRTRVTCIDDGEGMSFEHARSYLFSLYASSKEGNRNQVGRFGVGFWSILRFEPRRIVIASRTAGAAAWAIAFDGDLERGERWSPEISYGTRVILERAAGDGHDARRLRDAVWQNARYLHRRDDHDEPLDIYVDGERLNAPFTLAPPSARFARGPVRGVVGLGQSPRVELFSRGLRVRAAASLDDLLSASGHTSRSRVRFSELPGAVAPQALLESDTLELLLSRADARDDRTLRRLVKLANDELEWLVDRQLAQVRPPSPWERLARLFQRASGFSVTWRAVFGALMGALIALLIGRVLWGPLALGPATTEGTWRPAWLDAWQLGAPEIARPTGGGYADLARRYRGPQVSELDTDAPTKPVELVYSPPSESPYFAAMIVELDATGAPRAVVREGEPMTAVCGTDCIEVELGLDAPAGLLRIPLPTGHLIDASSVQLDGRPVDIVGSTADAPALDLSAPVRGVLTYRTGPGPAARSARPREPLGLPPALRRFAERSRNAPAEVRVETLVAEVRARVAYSTSAEVAALHRRARRDGEPFVSRSLAIGAGDCDVQNGLLVELLHAADVPARLAVGYVGRNGVVSPWLHAWVEWRDEAGHWRIADASETADATNLPLDRLEPLDAEPDDAGTPVAETGEDTAGVTDAPIPGGAGDAGPDAVGPDRTPPGERGSGASDPPSVADYAAPLAVVGGVLLLGLGLVRIRGQTRREVSLEQSQDLSRMLQGALQKPAAFARLPALFRRRLIPLVGGNAISLDQARRLATEGRLFRSRGDADLAKRVAARRIPVLDAATPEGQTVASTLGAVDLDRWNERLERARHTPALDEAEAALRREGYRWKLRAVSNLPELVVWLDLQALRLDRDHDRIILVDRMDPWHRSAETLATNRPAEAAFVLVQHLAGRMRLDERERARLLSPLAATLLQEDAS